MIDRLLFVLEFLLAIVGFCFLSVKISDKFLKTIEASFALLAFYLTPVSIFINWIIKGNIDFAMMYIVVPCMIILMFTFFVRLFKEFYSMRKHTKQT